MTLLIRSASSARLEIVENNTTLKPCLPAAPGTMSLVTIRNNTTLKLMSTPRALNCRFGYHQKQHNSQTQVNVYNRAVRFGYHLKQHNSQTGF